MAKGVLAGCGAVLIGIMAFLFMSGGGSGVEQTGYFKDDDRYRVMAFRAEEHLDQSAAEAALAGVMHSPGSTTWAVIYGPEARDPGLLLTTEKSRAAAVEMIMSPPFDGWDWYLTIRHDGLRSLKPR
ncbi:hypothetical protein ACSSV8_000010 [Roseovarius sp. MBR-79]|jgi:hypothetical protein